MDAESDRCALELSDARVDVLGYACLVAIMAMGHGYHRPVRSAPADAHRDNGGEAPVVTSAGALVDALKVIGAKRIALVAPYMKPLTELVVDYIRNEGYEVVEWRALEIPDNVEVGQPRSGPAPGHRRRDERPARSMRSCCPPACRCLRCRSVAKVEAMTGKPVITAAIATTYAMLKRSTRAGRAGRGCAAVRRLLTRLKALTGMRTP